MSSVFQVGPLSAEPGTKVQGFLEVNGTEVKMPITLINGAKEGKTVVITGGTHGGEYPGVETAIRLAKNLEPSQVSGKVAILHPVNVPAFYAKLQYYGPYDGKNLNREFPGLALGTVTQRIAYTISSLLFSQANFYFDLHGGDIHEALTPFVIYPTLGSKEENEMSRKLAVSSGIKYVCASTSETGTIGCASKMGIPCYLGEIGNCGLWSEDEVETYYKGVTNTLKLTGTLSGEPEENGNAVFLECMVGVNAGHTGCWYPSVKYEDQVKKGDKIGEIRDFFGNVLEEYFAPEAGVIIYTASSLAIVQGDPIACVGKPE